MDAAAAALGTDGPRALERLDALALDDCPELELWRHAYRALAARHASPEVEARELGRLEATLEQGDSDQLRRLAAHLRGRHLYRLSRFAEAARAHAVALELSDTPAQHLGEMLLAASAWLEAGEVQRARTTAEGGARLAAERRLVTLEAHATWLARTAAYRDGSVMIPDTELLEALDSLGQPSIASQIRFHEGVLAWRRGDHALAAALARIAERAWRDRDMTVPADLARLLGAEAGAELEPPEAGALADRADGVADASLRAQLGGLLARRGVPVRAPWRAALAELAGPEHRCWEVLSLAELRAALAE